MTDLSENELEERFEEGDYVKITNKADEYFCAIVQLAEVSTLNTPVGTIWRVKVLQDRDGNKVKGGSHWVNSDEITKVSWFDLC